MGPRKRAFGRSKSLLDKKLAGYTILGAAAFTITGVARAGSITYVPTVTGGSADANTATNSYTFNLSTTGGDIVLTAANTAAVGDPPSYEIDATATNGAMLLWEPAKYPYFPAGVADLAYGTTINPSTATVMAGGKMTTGFIFDPWPDNDSSGYMGFYFVGTSGPQAGWANISTSVDSSDATFTVNSYAYENDANTPLFAGQTYFGQTLTPEPSTLSLLALGGAGLLAVRKRRASHA